jgi:hypothetical protein
MAATFDTYVPSNAAPSHAGAGIAPPIARATILVVVAGCGILGLMFTDTQASARAAKLAGADLARLLRAMAAIKALLAAAVIATVTWRLALPAAAPRLAAYAAACASMAAGPGLIWDMAHVGTGALLLHGGLLAAILLLWRDPAMSARLAAAIEARRRAVA